jgi:hypothetical protein
MLLKRKANVDKASQIVMQSKRKKRRQVQIDCGGMDYVCKRSVSVRKSVSGQRLVTDFQEIFRQTSTFTKEY